MQRISIRASHTNSVNAVDTNSLVNVQLQNNTRPMEFTDIRKTVNQYEQYVNERQSCNQYRLIVTIRPYCTNTLFNTLTEVVYKEGSDEVDVVYGTRKAQKVDKDKVKVFGPVKPTRQQMIRNTEYSKKEVGYVYYPGYDIFNNHILRNTTFKIVNPIEPPKDNTGDENFNTIEDLQRYPNGGNVKFQPRTKLSEIKEETNKHLYNAEDIYSYIDCINANLTEENGWFGFINNSLVDARVQDKQTAHPDSLYIGRVDNSRNRCEFVDMYPDRTLYSFCPKYNEYRHRLEKNWELAITYPYRSDNTHPLVCNGLSVASIEKVGGVFGRDILLIRTYTKHGLQAGDSVYFYYSNDKKKWDKLSMSVNVTAVGDLEQNNKEYFFYITDLSLILEALGESYWYDTKTGAWPMSDVEINLALARLNVTFRHLVNGFESEYYFRVFRKLPNFKQTPENITREIGADKSDYIQFLNEHKVKCDFAHESYKLSFSNTVYGDENAQFTFTDTIDTTNIVDNLGRPLSELYVTIIKNNKGYKKWYTDPQPSFQGEEIEYSRCFGEVKSGLTFAMDSKEYATQAWLNKRHALNDITTMDLDSDGIDYYNEKIPGKEISIENDEFYGDVVELKPSEVRETVLSIIYHRFNTAQREYGLRGDSLEYDEFSSDDYDLDGFKVETTKVDNTVKRPEGYYYQAHYRIPLKSFGEVIQASHDEIRIQGAKPYFGETSIRILINTRQRHKLAENDVIYFCDDSINQWVPCHVTGTPTQTSFLIDPYEENYKDGANMTAKFKDWSCLCDILNSTNENQRYKVRQRNAAIPDYALKVGNNSFLWRPMYNPGDAEAVGLEAYPFVNNHFYIHRPIEFFLKRQDPHGYNGLYAKFNVPNDIPGKILPTNNYEHKEEGDMVC